MSRASAAAFDLVVLGLVALTVGSWVVEEIEGFLRRKPCSISSNESRS